MLSWSRRESILGRFDALSKFFWVFVIGVMAFTLPPILNLGLYGVLLVTAIALGRVGRRRMTFAVAITVGLGLFFLGGAIWYSSGTTVAQLGPLRITDEGLQIRAANAFRLMNVMLASFIFVWVTNPRDLVAGFIRLGLPYRIAYTIYVGLNYIPVLGNEMGYIRDAQRLRGISHSNPISALASYPRFLFAVLARALRRAQVTAFALDSKAFGAYPDRTYLNPFGWTTAGLIWLGLWLVIAVIGLIVGYGFGWWSAYFGAA
ncbi:MAG: energy-coupling factor transporter transmembrane protein EcfT [Chloroflexi bacterium]|nr:energy-coupling factor transporter transmembrane protein EcfT [Chloroflexota bacterium]